MKNGNTSSIVQIEVNELKNLVSEVKETVVKDFSNYATVKTSVFGVADLWKIQKQMKPALRQKLSNRWGM